jgi:arabinan endo-1,5-alpha-L-arabinosidase
MGLGAIAKDNIIYGYWAPVVRRVNVGGQEILRMYYSIVIDNYIKTGKANTSANFDGSWTERAFIGMCESTDPAGAVWTDKGFVTCSSSDRGKNYSRSSLSNWDAYFYYNAIDPTYIVTPEGKHYLIHGSWHSGFALLQVDATTGKPLNTLGEPYANSASELTARYGVRIGTRTVSSRWQGSEAPEIIYKDGYYYLFMAYDGLDIPYNTRVVRSVNIEGPYLDITGRNFTNGSGDCYPIVTHPYKFNLSNGRHITLLYLPKGKYQRMVLLVARTIACQRWWQRLLQCHYDGARTPHCMVSRLSKRTRQPVANSIARTLRSRT